LLRRSFTIPVIIASCIIPLFIIVLTSQNQKHQIEQFVFRFKNSNKKYLKIKGVAEEDVNRLLTEQETLLDLALKAVIEALRMTPDRYKIIYNSKYDNNDNRCIA
jgi:ferric iron reductase protein FhuF